MRKAMCVASLGFVAGCGSSSATLDPGMAGTWVGNTLVTIGDGHLRRNLL